MPDRMIREKARRSRSLKNLSDAAERAWWRLTVTCDDYGRFDADPEVCLAKLFERRPEGWNKPKMQRALEEWERAGLVTYYEVNLQRYGQVLGWSVYQRPPRLASKFPDPPDVITIPPERTVQQAILAAITKAARFCGHAVSAVNHNVRVGSGVADIVLGVPEGRIVIEVKRTRADRGSIEQVVRYRKRLKGCIGHLLIAAGIGPGVGPEDFAATDTALITYTADGTTTLAIPSKAITSCDLGVISQPHDAKSHHAGAISPIDPLRARIGGRGSGDEVRGPRDEVRGSGDVVEEGADRAASAPGAPPLPSNGLPDWFRETLAKSEHFSHLVEGQEKFWRTMSTRFDPYDWLAWDVELQKADAWCAANPQRAPTSRGAPAFLRNWFERAVERGRTRDAATQG